MARRNPGYNSSRGRRYRALNFLFARRAAAGCLLAAFCAGVTTLAAEQIKKDIPTVAKPSLLLRNQNGESPFD